VRAWCGFPGASSKSCFRRPPGLNFASKPIIFIGRLEIIAERKVRRRQLTDDGNVEITGRDLREREAPPASRRIGYRRFAR
jgi:hypothetical protein